MYVHIYVCIILRSACIYIHICMYVYIHIYIPFRKSPPNMLGIIKVLSVISAKYTRDLNSLTKSFESECNIFFVIVRLFGS
jgi:hypothetical protein